MGAVVLRDGELVGEGWHTAFGAPHAEVEALAAAGEAARGATVCVTLEPCCTRGKTGPCTEALLAAGVAEVVVGCVDPNPDHAGRGLEQLERAGLRVRLANSADSAALIRRFAAALDRRRPHVIAKWAQSADGFLAPADRSRRQLSGPAAGAWLHRVRAALDALVVGVGTVVADDPLLTCRHDGPRHRPLRRVVLDPQLRLPPASRLATTADETPTWVLTTEEAPLAAEETLRAQGLEVFRQPAGPRWLRDGLEHLHLQGVRRLLVEGGAATLTRFLADDLADQLAVVLTPVRLGDGLMPLEGRDLACDPAADDPRELAQTLRLQDQDVSALGEDRLLRGFLDPESAG